MARLTQLVAMFLPFWQTGHCLPHSPDAESRDSTAMPPLWAFPLRFVSQNEAPIQVSTPSSRHILSKYSFVRSFPVFLVLRRANPNFFSGLEIAPDPTTLEHERTLTCVAAPAPLLSTADDQDHPSAWIAHSEVYKSWFNQKSPQLLYIHGTSGVLE